MRIVVNGKRVAFTTSACFMIATLCLTLFNGDIILVSPFLFTLAIILTNLDRVGMNKYRAILLGLALTLPVFYMALLSTIGLGHWIGIYSIPLISLVAAAIMFLVHSLYIKMRSFKVGLVITALLALGSFPTVGIINKTFPNFDAPIALALDPTLFFICWQTLTALGISMGIWMQTQKRNEFIVF
ncbi:hypothetical protein GCM10023183_18040 [Nibribacter koreensis]|uniref:YhhN-like protein n=2 Tax=Nibribacter koreensis TaxID=1084519 RepID=A0ABP8FIM7_9BACT